MKRRPQPVFTVEIGLWLSKWRGQLAVGDVESIQVVSQHTSMKFHLLSEVTKTGLKNASPIFKANPGNFYGWF